MKKLSICIPSYNRAAYLPETLASIFGQWREGLEVTIADNASTDGTEQLVAEVRKAHPDLRYYRWSENMGADRNYLKAVEIATGSYCWILGSDDTLAPGAVATVMRAIEDRSADIVLFNRMLCSSKLAPTREDRFLKGAGAEKEDFEIRDDETFAAYLCRARTMCCAFSYLSSMAFRKERWDAVPTDERFIGSAYAHVQKLFGICVTGARLSYLNQPLVNCRLGNDSFRDLGLARRVLIDLEGYQQLTERCLRPTHPRSAALVKNLVLREYPFGRMLRYRGVLGKDPKWPEIQRLIRADYSYPRFTLAVANLLGRYRPIVNLSFFLRDFAAKHF